MVEKGADEIIHRVYIIIRKKRKKKKNPQKIKCFSQNIKKTKKKTRTYLRLEIVSSIFTRYATLYRGGA